MPTQHNTPVVIALGGSLVSPEGVDTNFVSSFITLISEYAQQGRSFAVIVGGGSLNKTYNKALQEIIETSPHMLDWLGIYATRMNAQFIRLAFKECASTTIVTNPEDFEISDMDASVVVGAGWKPGWSTDYVSVCLANKIGAPYIVNMSNIPCVYDKDPHTYSDAISYEKLNWAQYRALIPEEWSPRLSTPFDPMASRQAEESGLEVAIMGGDIDNLKHYLTSNTFTGTRIS